MDRTFSSQLWGLGLLSALVVSATTGCVHTLLATGIYLWNGGNVVPAEFDGLEEQRVVVICRPPASHEYRHAGAARSIGERVSQLLETKVKGIDMVSPSEVDNWIDEQDWENFKDLSRAVKANRVVYIELDDFDLFKGKTLYQGDALVNLSVYDMDAGGKLLWDRHLGQVLFPRNSGIPAADKSVQAFQRQFVEVLAMQIAEHFYEHDPNTRYALDAVANQ